VLEQSRKPDAVIVVVDLPQPTGQAPTMKERHAETDAYVSHLHCIYGGGGFQVTKNDRTKNVSGTGCWNTGIMLALAMEGVEYAGSTCETFIAILDDDDEWTPQHLQSCLEVCTAADWVVPGLIRDNGQRRTNEEATLGTLHVRDFLRGNPGVQGSNLFVRLSLILRSGMFDEDMNSMTDRDLCIRMLDALGPDAATRVAFTGLYTVIHHADPIGVRPRVTTDRPAKVVAIQKFLWRYAHRFSAEDFVAFSSRTRTIFQIEIQRPHQQDVCTVTEATVPTMSGDLVRLPQYALRYLSRAPFHLTWATHFEQTQTPLEKPTFLSTVQLTPARESSEILPGLFGIISSDTRRLQPLLADIASLPKHITASVIVFANTAEPARISDLRECARTVKGITIDVITVEDDYVLTVVSDYASACGLSALPEPPYEIGIARTILQLCMHRILSERKKIEFAMVLDDDKRLPRDSFLSASYVYSLDRSHIYIGQDCKTAPNTLANGLRGQLVDLAFTLERRSLLSTSERPVYTPTAGGTVCESDPIDAYYDLSTSRFDQLEEPQLFTDLNNLRDRVLRGDPLARVALPQIEQAPARQRGGCMLVFRENFSSLMCPQVLPEIVLDGSFLLSRRSDSLWLAYQAQTIPCTLFPGLFVLHENNFDSIPSPEKFRCNALAEACGSILCRPPQDRKAYFERRVCAMLSNNERIRGLVKLIRRSNEKELGSMVDELDVMFDEAAWRCEVFQPLSSNIVLLQNWSATLSIQMWTAGKILREELRTASIEEYHYIGSGNEGVVFRDQGRSKAIKVFVGDFPDKAIHLLCAKGILDCKRESSNVISYSFVHGEAYTGGKGKELVEMLRRLKDLSLVMTNVKPANLVVTSDGTVEIVDLGKDWTEYNPVLWKSMCRRAFLTWRFVKHCDTAGGHQNLKLLMQRERVEPFFAELTGFDFFFQCCEYSFTPFLDSERFEKIELAAYTPASRPVDSKCTFLLKSCLMESNTILANVRHLVWTMRRSGTTFREVVLSIDRTKRADLLRQYGAIDERLFDEALEKIKHEKLVDRVHNFCGSASLNQASVKEINRKYFGVEDSLATHSESGEPHASLFSALDSITTELVLQVDSDICINMHQHEDLVIRAERLFDLDPLAVTVLALPIYCKTPQLGIDGFVSPQQRPYRFEIRFSFLHLARFRSTLPLVVPAENRSDKPDHVLKNLGWYRVLDQQIMKMGLRSYRFFSPRGFWLHPTNESKKSLVNYMLLADRIGSADVVRRLPSSGLRTPSQDAWEAQQSSVNILASKDFFGERAEKIIFLCCGRNVPYGRALRCLE